MGLRASYAPKRMMEEGTEMSNCGVIPFHSARKPSRRTVESRTCHGDLAVEALLAWSLVRTWWGCWGGRVGRDARTVAGAE